MSKSEVASSLRAYEHLSDRIRLHRQADPRSIVVVEGPSDKRVFEDITARSDVVIFVGGNRGEVLKMAVTVPSMKIDRIACIVDRDFDELVTEMVDAGLPVVPYDGADLEGMLMGSPAAVRIIEELASDAKLAVYGVDKLLERVRREAGAIARLRRANATNGWELDFDDVDLTTKVDKDTLTLNLLRFCTALRQTTERAVTVIELQETANNGEIPRCPRVGCEIVRGRDQLALIGISLRRLVGTRPKAQTDAEFLATALRSAVRPEWLRSTEWFRTVRAVAGLPG